MLGIGNNRMIKQTLYNLEKRFSKTISVYAQIGVTNDAYQGISIPDVSMVSVRAIVLPEQNVRKYLYDAAYLATGRNFTYGGLFDEVSTPVIIKISRLKALDSVVGYTGLSTNDNCIIDGVRYDFRIVSKTADDSAYHILTKQSPAVGENEDE